MNRIGPAMKAAVEYVSANPGCPKLPCARAIGPNGSTKFGYAAIDRAMRAGLIEDRATGRSAYALHVTNAGYSAL